MGDARAAVGREAAKKGFTPPTSRLCPSQPIFFVDNLNCHQRVNAVIGSFGMVTGFFRAFDCAI